MNQKTWRMEKGTEAAQLKIDGFQCLSLSKLATFSRVKLQEARKG